jgi:two-component system sensor histidine kinase RegB
MTDIALDTPDTDAARPIRAEHGRISLRTLVIMRWITVAGQALTLLFVHLALGFTLPLQIALGVVAASAAVNVVVMIQRPATIRLGDRDATMYLAFDIVQLGALLCLTGGLLNPFAFLLLAPVTVGASTLSRNRTILLSLIALGITTLLGVWHLPLPWDQDVLDFPALYVLAVWLSLSVATLFIAAYTWHVSEEGRRMNDALAATQLALAREQRVSAVVALAAAAAHELGSPLGTIAVVAKELARDLPADSPFAEDAQLLLSETARCRTILADLAQPKNAETTSPFDTVPVGALAGAAAASHKQPHIEIVSLTNGDAAQQPSATITPELLHGLGNLLQNALQFARSQVTVTTGWDKRRVTIEILDDGPGISPQVLSRLGEPYLSSRSIEGDHMGLGIFIAETLLERTGGVIAFANRPQGGARVTVTWPRAVIETNPNKQKNRKEDSA